MTIIEAILLGIIQGLTEFFPVSSSGHLELTQYFLSLQHAEENVMFSLICHLGTLLALLLFFSERIKLTFTSDKTTFLQLLIAILPLFPLLLIIKPIKAFFHEPQYLGYCFLITGCLLYLGQKVRLNMSVRPQSKRWTDPFLIGIFQAFAVLPGISRSGSTISAGKMLGWEQEKAIRFSFLLAIPTILGGLCIEMLTLYKSPIPERLDIDWQPYIAGFLASFVVGIFALKSLMKLAANDKLSYFVWYCLGLGLITVLYFNR